MRFLFLLFLLVSCSPLPEFSRLKAGHPSSFREVLDEKGELLHETRTNFKVNRRGWIRLSDLPPTFVGELLKAEDKRFFSHPGFDPLALLSAIKEGRGGSTLTMQTVGLLQENRGRRSFSGKFFQILQAVRLELSWSKIEILESYLNLVSFKGELQGIRAASLGIFGKEPRGLQLQERTLLLAMLPSPNESSSRIVRRACGRSKDCSGLQEALNKSSFLLPKTERNFDLAPHVAAKFSQQEVKTTLRKNLQVRTRELLRSHIRALRQQNVADGAVIVLERKSARILAYVGSSGDFSRSSLVDHTRTLRQAGSTLKPLLFAQAIHHRLITTSTPLKDEPFTVTRDGQTYQPENYNKGYTHQLVPARVALGSSLNIPAVRVIDMVSPDRFFELLTTLKFTDLEEAETYGHSMALGAVDVSLWDLVRAYRALAEGGDLREPSLTGEGHPLSRVTEFTPESSYILGEVLSEKNNRSMTFGMQSVLATSSWSAVKTGTSKDMRDNWCIGWTDKYVIGIWVGNSSGSPMWNVTGVSGAAPLFTQLVNQLHEKEPSMAPQKPAAIVTLGEDHYLSGTEPRGTLELVESSSLQKILFPQHGSQFAWDPEIPSAKQKIFFQSSRKGKWRLNGRLLAEEDLIRGFSPDQKGKYRLELLEEEISRDEILFYVKAGRNTRL